MPTAPHLWASSPCSVPLFLFPTFLNSFLLPTQVCLQSEVPLRLFDPNTNDTINPNFIGGLRLKSLCYA